MYDSVSFNLYSTKGEALPTYYINYCSNDFIINKNRMYECNIREIIKHINYNPIEFK